MVTSTSCLSAGVLPRAVGPGVSPQDLSLGFPYLCHRPEGLGALGTSWAEWGQGKPWGAGSGMRLPPPPYFQPLSLPGPGMRGTGEGQVVPA